MSAPPSLPSLEPAAALADEGKRVLMGHWVAASVEPLQRSLETLRQLELAGHGAAATQTLRVEALSCLNLALDASGRFGEAASARRELERCLGEPTEALSAALALWWMGCAAQLRGDIGALLSLGERAAMLMDEPEVLAAAAAHHALLGWALVMDGEADEGLDELHASAVHRRRHGSVVDHRWLSTTCAEARLVAGAFDEARRELESAEAALVPGSTRFMQGFGWRVRGNLRWAAGEGLAAASADWQQALAADQAAGAPLCELQTLLVLGRALSASGDKGRAREGLAEVLSRLGAAASADAGCPVLDIARRQLAAWS